MRGNFSCSLFTGSQLSCILESSGELKKKKKYRYPGPSSNQLNPKYFILSFSSDSERPRWIRTPSQVTCLKKITKLLEVGAKYVYFCLMMLWLLPLDILLPLGVRSRKLSIRKSSQSCLPSLVYGWCTDFKFIRLWHSSHSPWFGARAPQCPPGDPLARFYSSPKAVSRPDMISLLNLSSLCAENHYFILSFPLIFLTPVFFIF